MDDAEAARQERIKQDEELQKSLREKAIADSERHDKEVARLKAEASKGPALPLDPPAEAPAKKTK